MRFNAQDRRLGEGGFSFPEMLVVITIIGLAAAVVVPLTRDQVAGARARAGADQFTTDLRAARMIAVTTRSTLDMTVVAHPGNYYEYTDNKGRLRRVNMPNGVQISSSTSPIQFQLNGSLTTAASTVIEVQLGKSTTERYTIDTNILGVPTVTHSRF